MTIPKTPLLSDALRDAIRLIDGALANATCRDQVKGSRPSELRTRRAMYEALLNKLEPRGGKP